MIKTIRLLIIPLSYNQLKKYLRNDYSLEKELNLNKIPRVIQADFSETLEKSILPDVANANKNHLFSTLWTIILQDKNTMIGDMCFMGEPDKEGKLELGYGTYKDFRGNGYMQEAVNGLIHWAFNQFGVKSIIASTEKRNVASQTILLKNKFTKINESDNLFTYQLKK